MIINQKAKKPIDACMRVLKGKIKESGRKPAELAAELGVTPQEFKGWFQDGSMPYSAFLSLVVAVHTKATTVFEEAKALVKKEKAAASEAAANKTETIAPAAEPAPETPASAPATAAPVTDAIDDGADAEEEENEAYETADDGSASTAEAAPGVPLTDKSSPEALPYALGDFTLAKTDPTMTDVDKTLMEWSIIVSEALDAHTDARNPMTPDRKAKLTAKYPKPGKTDNPAEISITFGSYASAQRFANDGYLNDLQAVVSKRGCDITLLPLPIKE